MRRAPSTLFVRLPPLSVPMPDGQTPPPARPALLERLLCRADERAGAADWRREAFGRIAAPDESYPEVAPAALFAALGVCDGAAVYLATPVHYEPTMSGVRLAEDGILAQGADEAGRLAREFNQEFGGDRQRLIAAPSGTLFCVFAEPLGAVTWDPSDLAGADVGPFQAAGLDARRLRALASEIEMWLFEHAINRARAERGLATIDGLWLWGGGAPLARAPRVVGWAGGADPLFATLDRRADFAAGAGAGSGVVCVAATPGSGDWPEVERRWLAPALAALGVPGAPGARRLDAIELSVGARVFRLGAAERLRLWRRRRPWWERLA